MSTKYAGIGSFGSQGSKFLINFGGKIVSLPLSHLTKGGITDMEEGCARLCEVKKHVAIEQWTIANRIQQGHGVSNYVLVCPIFTNIRQWCLHF